jgi:hypothetical protein
MWEQTKTTSDECFSNLDNMEATHFVIVPIQIQQVFYGINFLFFFNLYQAHLRSCVGSNASAWLSIHLVIYFSSWF